MTLNVVLKVKSSCSVYVMREKPFISRIDRKFVLCQQVWRNDSNFPLLFENRTPRTISSNSINDSNKTFQAPVIEAFTKNEILHI